MKFKSIFIVFNIVIALSFLFFFLMPVFILGLDHFLIFITNYWVALLLFLILLIFLLIEKFHKCLHNTDINLLYL